jgi:hypothetical protein
MTDGCPKTKWHPVEPTIVKRLTEGTTTPGFVFPVGASAVPQQLHGMPGAVSYFVSSYIQGAPVAPGMTAGGEYAVVRHDGDTAKAYNYVFGTSSDGHVYFAGPHKDFPSHHFAVSKAVPVESLFGHPLTKGKP